MRKVDFDEKKKEMHYVLTATEASLAATATISAQETTPGHSFSTSDLASSITSNPLTEF